MSDTAALALQKAVVAACIVGAPQVAGRVYDSVPPSAAFPFIAMGALEEREDGAGCIDASEVTLHVHVHSDTPGRVEAQRIAASLIPDVLAITAVDGFALVELRHRQTRHLTEPDGLRTQAIVEFEAILEA